MDTFTAIIFSGNRVNAGHAANRAMMNNAELVAVGTAMLPSSLHAYCEGMWLGNGEPSHLLVLPICKEEGVGMAKGLLAMFQQDAVIMATIELDGEAAPVRSDVLLALGRAQFTMLYKDGSKQGSSRARLLPASACYALDSWTRIGDLGLVIDF